LRPSKEPGVPPRAPGSLHGWSRAPDIGLDSTQGLCAMIAAENGRSPTGATKVRGVE
jgi:hypothetical protein